MHLGVRFSPFLSLLRAQNVPTHRWITATAASRYPKHPRYRSTTSVLRIPARSSHIHRSPLNNHPESRQTRQVRHHPPPPLPFSRCLDHHHHSQTSAAATPFAAARQTPSYHHQHHQQGNPQYTPFFSPQTTPTKAEQLFSVERCCH